MWEKDDSELKMMEKSKLSFPSGHNKSQIILQVPWLLTFLKRNWSTSKKSSEKKIRKIQLFIETLNCKNILKLILLNKNEIVAILIFFIGRFYWG